MALVDAARGRRDDRRGRRRRDPDRAAGDGRADRAERRPARAQALVFGCTVRTATCRGAGRRGRATGRRSARSSGRRCAAAGLPPSARCGFAEAALKAGCRASRIAFRASAKRVRAIAIRAARRCDSIDCRWRRDATRGRGTRRSARTGPPRSGAGCRSPRAEGRERRCRSGRRCECDGRLRSRAARECADARGSRIAAAARTRGFGARCRGAAVRSSADRRGTWQGLTGQAGNAIRFAEAHPAPCGRCRRERRGRSHGGHAACHVHCGDPAPARGRRP